MPEGPRFRRWKLGSGLRGAEAVYAAVAQQYRTTLITLDRQQWERLPPTVKTARQAEVLGERESRS